MSTSSNKTHWKGDVEMGKVGETRDGVRIGECVCVCACVRVVHASMWVCGYVGM